MSNLIKNTLNKFLSEDDDVEIDPKTGKTKLTSKDGLIERTLIEKQLVVEDGRQLLREETPISHTRRIL